MGESDISPKIPANGGESSAAAHTELCSVALLTEHENPSNIISRKVGDEHGTNEPKTQSFMPYCYC